jgi:hypothetical protein
MISFYFNYVFKDFVSKYSCIVTWRELEVLHVNLREETSYLTTKTQQVDYRDYKLYFRERYQTCSTSDFLHHDWPWRNQQESKGTAGVFRDWLISKTEAVKCSWERVNWKRMQEFGPYCSPATALGQTFTFSSKLIENDWEFGLNSSILPIKEAWYLHSKIAQPKMSSQPQIAKHLRSPTVLNEKQCNVLQIPTKAKILEQMDLELSI